MQQYLSGMITMGFAVSGVFFLRFWSRTQERLFLAFACAFGLFALNQMLVAMADIPREEQGWFYLLRLTGFGLIIAGICLKNFGRATRP